MFFLTGAGGSAATGYQISRSLRFNDDDSADMTRTNGSAGNRRLWTWSCWLKRGNISKYATIFHGGVNSGAGATYLHFENTNTLNLYFAGADYRTTQVFRDPSAWYHIVCLWDTAQATASERLKIWINNQLQTLSALPAQNSDSFWNNSGTMYIGSLLGSSFPTYYFDGYLAEVHFVDGTALTPSSFGETDATTGVWKPKRATGITYGTNGFYLSFADNTSTTTLGYDDAGGAAGSGAGSNDWTLNNFSVTAGAGNDSLLDTPTDNFGVFNKLNTASTGTLANGQLDCGASGIAVGGFGMSSGSWYWEVTSSGGTTTCGMWNGSATSTTTVTTGNTKGFRFDADAGTFDQTSDGSSWTSIATGLTSGPYFVYVSTAAATTASLNTGQRTYAYTQPTNYKKLSTAQLPTPTIRKPSQYCNAVTYTGTGSSLAVTGVGHQPDLVWIKSRSAATDHALYDAVRGVQARLESNQTDAEATTDAGLTAFGTDGFTVNTLAQVNTNTATYVGWCWKEGVTPGFDIVSYTGDNTSNRNINHSLGAAPHFAIIKDRSNAEDWFVYHRSLSGATSFLTLNGTGAQSTANTPWGTGNWSSTQFMVTNNATNNANANLANYIAYLFTEISGFSRIGSYTGNGSADGVFVWTGHRPRYVLIKRTDTTASWVVFDTARMTYNALGNVLYPDLSAAEALTTTMPIDILSNGFKLRDTDSEYNANTGTYVFASFAESPFKYSLAR